MSELVYIVKRGKNAGIPLAPHWFTDGGGHFRAHKTNSRNDPEGRRVRTETEFVDLVRLGYHVRMSNPILGHAPSQWGQRGTHRLLPWSQVPRGALRQDGPGQARPEMRQPAPRRGRVDLKPPAGRLILHAMPQFQFLHTADWQIGRVFSQFDEEDGAALAAARTDAVRRIAELAAREQVDAVLVAGDVFDAQGVRDKTVDRLFLAMAAFAGPWLLLPGNHDAALAESVWSRAQRRGVIPANVTACLAPVPVTLPGKAVILPAPLVQRHTYSDLTAWFDTADTDPQLPRIGLAHGSVQGLLAQDIDASNPIAADRVTRARLDYLALGDWHGTRQVEPRCWYAGTPETDRFRDNDSGQALRVTIDGPGATPQVRAERTGAFRWVTQEHALGGPTDVDQALAALGTLDAHCVAQVRLTGLADLAGHRRLAQAVDGLSARVRALLWDTDALRALPTDDDIAALHADGFVGEVLQQLREQQVGGGSDGEQARDALLALAGFLDGVGRPAPTALPSGNVPAQVAA